MNKFYSVSFDETNKEFSVRTFADKGPWYVRILPPSIGSPYIEYRIVSEDSKKQFEANIQAKKDAGEKFSPGTVAWFMTKIKFQGPFRTKEEAKAKKAELKGKK